MSVCLFVCLTYSQKRPTLGKKKFHHTFQNVSEDVFDKKKFWNFSGNSPVLTLFYLKSQIFRQFLLFFDHFGTKYGQICQSKSGELSKNDHLFFWKNLHFDDVITDDVIMVFRGVKSLKMLFFNHFRAKNGQICQSKSWELSKNHQLFFWKIFILMTSSLMMS